MKTMWAVMFAATLGCGGAQRGAPETAPALKAETADAQTEEMRALFEKGQDAYEQKRYQDAADAFMAAYAIKPAASLLYNTGVAREKLGDRAGAAEMFRRYLDESPNARDRTAVEERIAALTAP
jgi:tetratricopeptide (TPR) repeat protein